MDKNENSFCNPLYECNGLFKQLETVRCLVQIMNVKDKMSTKQSDLIIL